MSDIAKGGGGADMTEAVPHSGVVTTNPDPTQNVRELVVAGNLRSDDLRRASEQRLEDLAVAERRRVDESVTALRREAELRAEFARDLNLAETKRIDAIRAVDVAAVAIANERATAQATVLANQVATSAETLRALVATQAAASAQQFATSTSQLSDRISLLERSSYEGQGRSTLANPALDQLNRAVAELMAKQDKGEGRQALSTPLLIALASAGGGLALYLIETLMRGHP